MKKIPRYTTRVSDVIIKAQSKKRTKIMKIIIIIIISLSREHVSVTLPEFFQSPTQPPRFTTHHHNHTTVPLSLSLSLSLSLNIYIYIYNLFFFFFFLFFYYPTFLFLFFLESVYLKQPQQTCCLVISKTLFNDRWGHANSRFEREIDEAAPGCFFNFYLRVYSAIHLHCARKQCNSLHCARKHCK
jgi:hypothetical protein